MLPLVEVVGAAPLYASVGLGKNASRVGEEIGEDDGKVEEGGVRRWGV